MKKIQLSQGFEALVDDEDFERVSRLKWSAHSAGYATAHDPDQCVPGNTSSSLVLLHRYILGLKPGDSARVDHRNHDKLDCRHKNLRIGSQSMNMMNRIETIREGFSSKYRGVYHRGGVSRIYSGPKPWRGQYRGKYVGVFEDEKEAAYCRDLAALRDAGLSAQLNFPIEGLEVCSV